MTKYLPDEMLLKMFKMLPLKDLCNVCLVSIRWNSIGSEPSLWRRFQVEMVINDAQKASDAFKCSRFSKLFLNYNFALEESHINTKTLLQSNITRLNLKWVDMRYVMKNAVLLLARLESLTITNCRMEQAQVEEMFKRLGEGTSLKEICIINPIINCEGEMVGLSRVSPEVLGRGLSKIRSVQLHKVKLTTEQIKSLEINIEMKKENQILEISGQSKTSLRI